MLIVEHTHFHQFSSENEHLTDPSGTKNTNHIFDLRNFKYMNMETRNAVQCTLVHRERKI